MFLSLSYSSFEWINHLSRIPLEIVCSGQVEAAYYEADSTPITLPALAPAVPPR